MISPQFNELCRRAVEISNDVIAFDAHRIAVWSNKSNALSGTWHHQSGLIDTPDSHPGPEWKTELTELFSSGDSAQMFEIAGSQYCAVSFDIDETHQAAIVIRRSTRRPGDCPAPFTCVELEQLYAVSQLLERALISQNVDMLLRALHLELIDRRTYIQELPSSSVLDEYLDKAEYLLSSHLGRIAISRSQRDQSPTVRSCAKVVTRGRQSLKIVAHRSTEPADWTPLQVAQQYPLIDGRGSIARIVYEELTTVSTNDYQNLDAERIVLFPDTTCHISSPIVAGNEPSASGHADCLGVLSIEAADVHDFDDDIVNVITLLAAHAAWPLRRALLREESVERLKDSQRIIDFAADVQNCEAIDLPVRFDMPAEDTVWHVFKETLKGLGYERGIVCSVEYLTDSQEEFDVVGVFAWGPLMKRVAQLTSRNSGRDRDDCQVQAVRSALPHTVRDPENDHHASRDAFAAGNLTPFTVFPLVDSRGVVRYTVHCERSDVSPLGEVERQHVQHLCDAVMRTILTRQISAIERQWTDDLVSRPPVSAVDAAKSLASRLRLAGLFANVAVCRHGDGEIAISKSVPPQSITSQSLEHCDPMAIVVVNNSARRVPASGDYHVVYAKVDSISNEALEYVVIDVPEVGATSASLIIDNRRRPSAEFDRAELVFFSRIARGLQRIAERAQSERVMAQLSAVGLASSMIKHHMRRALEDIDASDGDGASYIEALDGILDCTEGVSGEVVVSEELKLAKQIAEPPTEANIVLTMAAENCADAVPDAGRTLLLVVLAFLQNAVDAVRKANVSSDIVINTDVEGPYLAVTVTDSSGQLNDESELQVCHIFDRPREALLDGETRVSALVLSALLCKRLGWGLSLLREGPQATFRLELTGQKVDSRLTSESDRASSESAMDRPYQLKEDSGI